jgi:hypothetical protein
VCQGPLACCACARKTARTPGATFFEQVSKPRHPACTRRLVPAFERWTGAARRPLRRRRRSRPCRAKASADSGCQAQPHPLRRPGHAVLDASGHAGARRGVGVQQHVRAGGQVVGPRVLDLVVR